MAFRKFQKAEKLEVVAAADAPATLRKFGVARSCQEADCHGDCEACLVEKHEENLTEN